MNTSLAIKPQPISYDINDWSSHSASYLPEHIKVNKPQDQSSRWSSGSNNQMQFITVKLEQMSIISISPLTQDTITFGKYHKVHVCNLREFKVYGLLSLILQVEYLQLI
jgi:hypothetical protein